MKKIEKKNNVLFSILVFFFWKITYQQTNQNTNQNLMENGNFSDNQCQYDYCLQSYLHKNNLVRNWIFQGHTEIANANINIKDQTSTAKSIVFRRDSCIKQSVPKIDVGTLNLIVVWAAKNNTLSLTTKKLQIYVNENLILNASANDYSKQQNNITFQSPGGCSLMQIKICGALSVVTNVYLYGKRINTLTVQVPTTMIPGFYNPSTIINSYNSDCFRRTFALLADYYELKFNYKATGVSSLFKAHLITYWNGKILNIITPEDQAKKFLFFQVFANAGKNELTFCPSVCLQEGVFHQIFVDNEISLTRKTCLTGKYVNLIKNGDFQNNTCTNTHYCFQNLITFPSINLDNWSINNEIQLPNGGSFNVYLPWSRMIQLQVNKDQCIKQKIPILINGNYVLQIDYFPRNQLAYNYNSFNWTISNIVNQTYTPIDYFFKSIHFQFNLLQTLINGQLIICGCGLNKTLGALIDNIQLYYLDDCLTQKSFSYSTQQITNNL